MSRKFFKTLVLTGMAAMLSTGAYAAEMGDDYSFKVKGKLRTYFGQYNSGVDGETAYMTEFNEGNLAGAVERGPMKGYFEVESREGSQFKASMRTITMDVGSGLNVGIGTFKPKWGYAFSWGSGMATSDSAKVGFFSGLLNKMEEDGLNVEYKTGDHKMGFTIYEQDAQTKTEGSTTQIGAAGKVAGLAYRVNSLSSTSDAHDGSDTLSHSGTHLGVKYSMDAFAISLDIESKTIQKADSGTTDATTGVTTFKNGGDAYNDTTSATSVQGTVNLGDNKLIVTVGSTSEKADYTGASETKIADTDLLYVMPVAKGADFRVAYGSQGETPDGGDTVTQSFVGAGMFIKF